jgi:hypothetical protein
MKYFAISNAVQKKHSMFGSSVHKIKSAIIALTDKMAAYYKDKDAQEIRTDGIVYNDGTYLFGASTHIVSATMREATQEEIKFFTETAASINLSYQTLLAHHKNIWTKEEWDEPYEALGYIDKSKILFKLNKELVTFDQLKEYEPPTGLFFAFYHDNGYSYLGIDPTSKENYLSAVSKIDRVHIGNLYGIDYLENGIINVRFCSKPYHEVSNT